MPGLKHLIECHCYLAINKNINHKFPVFSKLKDDKLIQHYEKCNNCGALHKIIEIGKSEFFSGKEDAKYSLEKEDYIQMLPEKVVNALIKAESDIANFSHALEIIESESWGEKIVISREKIDKGWNLKILEINSPTAIKIYFKEITNVVE